MGRRKKSTAEVTGSIKDWEITTEIQINGRNVEPGTELKIKGERGRFRFIKYVVAPEGSWIDVWGGTKHAQQLRSFRLDRVARVHYKNTTDKALAQEYKEKKAIIKEESSRGDNENE